MTDPTPSHASPSSDPVELVDPVVAVEPAAPAEPAAPVQPAAPAEPAASAPSAEPAEPTDPVANAEHLLTQALARTVQNLPGVYALGSPATRMLGVARSTLTGTEHLAGVTVTANPPRLDVTVSLVAEYPANVTDLADAARAAITAELAPHHIGPLHIDVTVTDVHGPFDTPIVADVADDAEAASQDAPADELVGDDDADLETDASSAARTDGDGDGAEPHDTERAAGDADAASEHVVSSAPIEVTVPDSDRDVTVRIQVEVEPAEPAAEAANEPAAEPPAAAASEPAAEPEDTTTAGETPARASAAPAAPTEAP